MPDNTYNHKIACDEYPSCKDRRVADAEHRGAVIAKLENIENNVSALWREIKQNRAEADLKDVALNSDIKSIYFKMGIISGTVSLIVSLVVSLVTK